MSLTIAIKEVNFSWTIKKLNYKRLHQYLPNEIVEHVTKNLMI